MADGCNLYLNEEESILLENSLKKGIPSDKVEKARSVLNGGIINNINGFKSILSNPNSQQHQFVQQLLEITLGKGDLLREDELKLSEALWTVLDKHPNPQGIFEAIPRYRGPDAKKMLHGGELLTAAAIIKNHGVSTSLGTTLFIKSEDNIAFGQKLPANYSLGTGKKKSGKMETYEADTFIHREDGTLVGIDTKYSRTGSNISIKERDDFERQLEGIRKGFKDGSIDEFYFVSNMYFQLNFKNKVLEYNRKICIDRLQCDAEMRHDFGKDMKSDFELANAYCKDDEIKDISIPSKFDQSFYNKEGKLDSENVNKFAKIYHVPQIGLCEHVNF